MDLYSYSGVASSSKSVSASVGSSEDDSQSSDDATYKHCSAKSKEISIQRKYNKKWKRISCGWNMTTIIKEHFVRSVESRSLSHFKKTGGA